MNGNLETEQRPFARQVVLFILFVVAVLGLQFWMGAFNVERGIYSDDAAHFMNGLVIRDYLTTAFGHDPMTFAENYYFSFPKIAPLMWPPLFHVALGVFLLPGWPPGIASLIFVAFTAAWLGWRLYGIVRALVGTVPAFLCAAFVMTTPLIQSLSGVVMLDVAIAALGVEAVYWLARYAHSLRLRHAILFGVFTAAACLTKGNGAAVVLTPLAFMAMTARYDLLRRSGLYLAAAIVVVFAVPLLAVSARLDAAIGDFGPVTWEDISYRVEFYGMHLAEQMGPALLALSACGLAISLRKNWLGARPRGPLLAEALASLALATLLFHVFNPHRAAVSRYLSTAIGPLIGLAFFAALTVVDRFTGINRRQTMRVLVTVGIVAATLVARPVPQRKVTLGYRDIVRRLAASGDLAGRRLLVVSDETGEGAFVTEAAILGLDPRPTIIRGSKLLGDDNWVGKGFRMTYTTPAAVLADLEALHVAYVVVDLSENARKLPYFSQLQTLADTESARFALTYSREADEANGPSRTLALYRITSPSEGPPRPYQVSLGSSLGRSLTR